ncbi:hemolysin family protein [Ferrovibrio xuzhouensis]|uniref:Hemolysin family protein n=1 Tax=Ferrovibrio xuzhouensis TaxID=1576914 RepID=A0ABV7VD36_9PROT
MSHWLELALIALLILVNGFLAMAELAVVSARRPRLQAMARRKGRGVQAPNIQARGARIALQLGENPGRFLSSVQTGITLVGILAGAYSGATLADPLAGWLVARFPLLDGVAGNLAFGIVVGSVTYLSLIVGELVPKQLALKDPERIAAFVAPVLLLLAQVAAPLVWLLDRSSALLLRLLGAGRTLREAVSEEEIRHLVAEAETAGIVEPEERRMIAAVMKLGDRPVRAVMTPRHELAWLDLAQPHDVQVQRLRDTVHLRLPAAQGGIDEPVGVVIVKDVLNLLLDQGRDALAEQGLGSLVQPVPAVHESADVLDALEMLKQSPGGMIFVVDEFGSLEGIVTPGDILESIAGSFALPDGSGEHGAVRRADGSWLLDGLMPRGDVADRIGLALPEEGEHHTLAGFLLDRFGRLPETGDSIDWNGWRFEVLDMDGRRIDKILAVPPPPELEPASDI